MICQHHLALEVAHVLLADLDLALLVVRQRLAHEVLVQLVGRDAGVEQLLHALAHWPQRGGLGQQAVEVPLLGVVRRAVGLDGRLDRLRHDVLDDIVPEVGGVEDLVAAPVDHRALLVHDLVVLQHVLADLGVSSARPCSGPARWPWRPSSLRWPRPPAAPATSPSSWRRWRTVA